MKLGTLRNGKRDGRLVVVSADVTLCSDAHHIAPTLQYALDNWDRVAPHLDLIARGLESGGQPTERFHEREAHAPLPRAFQWIAATGDGAAPPHLHQRASDGFLDPRAAIRGPAGLRVGAGLAAIVGDVPQGADMATAVAAIRLVMLVNALEAGGGPGHATFSPVAVTPNALAQGWDSGRLSGTLHVDVNGKPLSRLSSAELECDFATLISAAARDRALSAGSVVSSGLLAQGDAALKPGDTVRIEMRDAAGHSIFGAIEQGVLGVEAAA